MKNLSDLHLGETGTVTAVVATGAMRKRLFDLGIVEGAKIKALFTAPSGNPTAYLIRGTTIALRKCDSRNIHID